MNTDPGRRLRGAEIAVLAAAAVWLGFIVRLGINPVDEGMELLRAYEIRRGLVTYRDVYSPIAPFSYFIQAALMRLFGMHLVVGRAWAALEGLAAVWIALTLGRRLLRPPFALLPAALLIPFGAALGGFPHYNTTALFFFLAAAGVLSGWLDRPTAGRLFAAAALAALAALTKQSLAGPAVLLVALALWLRRSRPGGLPVRKEIVAAVAGLALPPLLLAAYYASQGGLSEIARDLFGALAMKRAVLIGLLPRALLLILPCLAAVWGCIRLGRARPQLWPALGGLAIVSAALPLFLLPLPLSGPFVTGMIVLSLLLFVGPGPVGDRAQWFFIRGFGLLVLVNGLMSGIDFGHLLMCALAAVFSGGLLLQRAFDLSIGRRAASAVAAAGLGLVAMGGLWLDLAVPHLSYAMPPRLLATARVHLPGFEGIRVAPSQAKALGGVVGWLRDHTSPDEKIYVYPWAQIIYPLADRLPAARDTFLYFEMFDNDALGRLLTDLDRNRPRVLVIEMDGDRFRQVSTSGPARAFERWAGSRYVASDRFGDYQLLLRRDQAPDAPNQER